MTTENDFASWLDNELNKRGWRPATLARRAGVGNDVISRILNRERGIGPEVCIGIAKAFKLPPETVFRIAGLLPPETAEDEGFEEWKYLLSQLSVREREELYECEDPKLNI